MKPTLVFQATKMEVDQRGEGVLERVMFLVDLRRPLCIFPAAKKTRSTPANEAGAARYCLTISWPAQATCSISVLPELEQVSSRSRLRQAMPVQVSASSWSFRPSVNIPFPTPLPGGAQNVVGQRPAGLSQRLCELWAHVLSTFEQMCFEELSSLRKV